MCTQKEPNYRLYQVGDIVEVNCGGSFTPGQRKVTAVKTEEPAGEGALPIQFVTVVRVDGKGIPMTFARPFLELIEAVSD